MAGKKKKKTKRPTRTTVAPTPTVAAAPAPRRTRRRRAAASVRVTPRRTMTPWFMVFSGSVTVNKNTIVLLNKILHPSAFPGTPYFNGNADFAFRTEHRVEVDILITSGTLVGSRFAVAVDRNLSNPRVVGRELLLNLVLNGLGAMVTAAGPTDRRATFGVNGPTTLLSNSPPPSLDLVGFSQGRLLVGAIDPPVVGEDGVETTATLTVMLRVDFTPSTPAPQTLAGVVVPFPPGPGEGPGVLPQPTEEEVLEVSWTEAQNLPPAVWHQGDAYLASGAFWRTDEAADAMPTVHGHTVAVQTWTRSRRPTPGCVYEAKSTGDFPVWPFASTGHNPWGSPGNVPRYFTCYASSAGGWVGLVGFADLYYAVLQATWPSTVPAGHELQLGDFWGTTGGEGAKPSVSQAFGGQKVTLTRVYSPTSGGSNGPPSSSTAALLALRQSTMTRRQHSIPSRQELFQACQTLNRAWDHYLEELPDSDLTSLAEQIESLLLETERIRNSRLPRP